ncbi:MAG: Flp pilus assembly complex ATPase component TadA [Clostridiales bacterium]|nr:Flp pilus assembly complex ATPase component TadA [Clostridiales bacterium]
MFTRASISELQQKAVKSVLFNGAAENAADTRKYMRLSFEEALDMCQRYVSRAATEAFRRENDPAKRREMTIGYINEFVDEQQAGRSEHKQLFSVDGFDSLAGLKIALADEITHYGPITKAMEDPAVDEIRANAFNQIFVESEGKTLLLGKHFSDREHMERIIQKLIGVSKMRLTPKTPMVNARTVEGYRVNATHAEISPYSQPAFVVRKFNKKTVTAERMIQTRSFSRNMFRLLSLIPKADLSWITVGPTGSGKTTLNEILVQEINPLSRIITIENPSELRLIRRDAQGRIINDVLQYESVADDDDASPATIENLLVNAMRQSPHWIGPGELRTPGEFATALRAAQTGHYFFTTLHAEGDKKAILRFLTAYLMISSEPAELALRNICNAIKFIIYVEKLADGSRKITSISEVTGSEGLEPLVNQIYTFEYEDVEEDELTHAVLRIIGRHKRVGCISPETRDKMLKSGIKKSRFEFLTEPPVYYETEEY